MDVTRIAVINVLENVKRRVLNDYVDTDELNEIFQSIARFTDADCEDN